VVCAEAGATANRPITIPAITEATARDLQSLDTTRHTVRTAAPPSRRIGVPSNMA
jgi:hypothetical protein